MKKLLLLSITSLLFVSTASATKSLLTQIKTGSTPLYTYQDKKLQDLSGSAFVDGHIYLMSDGGKNSNFPEIRISSLDKLDLPADVFQRQIIQRDTEGATQIGSTIYITSSMSQVNEDTADYRVLSAIKVDKNGELLSEKYTYAREMIISAMTKEFGDNDWLRRVRVSFGKSGGINVEGLSTSHNKGDKLVFGFRSPLLDENFGSPELNPAFSLKKGLAILMEVNDPIFNETLDTSFKLIDLGGQGIRGIEYIPAMEGYVIISGGVEKLNEYHLWFYDPKTEKVIKLDKAKDDFSHLCRPESVLNIADSSTLIIFSEESGNACSKAKFNSITYQY